MHPSEAAYDPLTMQPEGWRRDRMGPYERDYDRYPRHQRDLVHRAGGEIAPSPTCGLA